MAGSPTSSCNDLINRINRYQGCNYLTLKDKQWAAIEGAKSNDVLAVLPTGYGKTIIIQALPFLGNDPTCIVVANPLNAIIMEQAARFGSRCVVVNSTLLNILRKGMDVDEAEEDGDESQREEEGKLQKAKDNAKKLRDGDVSFIIGHPEHLLSDVMKKVFQIEPLASKITHLVVDEAHCIISWGRSDFRPAFLKLGLLRAILDRAKVVALTATATRKAQEEIKEVLLMLDPLIIRESPDRPGMYLEVKERLPSTGKCTVEESVNAMVDPILLKLRDEGILFPKTIMYMPLKWCGYIHQRAVSQYLTDHPEETTVQDPGSHNLTCLISQFHAPQSEGMKERISEAMQDPHSHLRLLLCTEAYSMGADPAGVDQVIHVGPPNTIETYIQEIGRCGRDGTPSSATLMFNNSDLGANREYLQQELRDYARATTCRRQFLMAYFDFEVDPDRSLHDCCDNCRRSCDCMCEICLSQLLANNDITEPAPETLQQCCINSLEHYFALENSLSQGPIPEGITGLSKSLAASLAEDPFKYRCATALQEAFPTLKTAYIENICALLDAEITLFEQN